MVERFVAANPRVCVILLSSVADQYLWEEVVHSGGFDLLTRPFRQEHVLSKLSFAYSHWRGRWPIAKIVR